MSSSLSERLAALSPEQRELLRRRLAERDGGRAADASTSAPPVSDAPIPRRDLDAPLPLSHAQERLWFLNRLERDSAFYNIPMGLRMRGALDADALERALCEVVRRHEVLRTTFAAKAGVPHQVVHEALPPGFARVDRIDVPEAERAAALAEAARDEARRPFDMERGPLIRGALVRFASDDHGFLLSVHHTVADGWSRGVIVRELETLYAAFFEGHPSPLPMLEIQYGDFAVWQREWLSGDRLEAEMRYWEERLADLRELRLPTDRPRSADTVHEGAKLLEVLPQALLDDIKRFAKEARVTPFMVLLAAFDVLLQRQSGQEDIVVGVPTANRNWPATEPLVGFFVNSLVMRTDLGGDPTFRELLERVRKTAVGAFDHRNVPFERIVERLRPERTLGRNPLFQVTLQFQDASYGRQNSLNPQHDFPGLSIERLPIDTGTALFDLSVNLGEIEEGLGVLVEYSTALWDGERIASLVRQLVRLVEDGMARPDTPISALAWLDAADRSQALVHARQSVERDDAVPSLGAPVHRRVAAHAAARPDAVALVDGNRELSYRELVARARRLAVVLAESGAGADRVVALCLPRGIGTALAPLAALEAGAAYLPLDPADPVQRRVATAQDAGARVVVTDAERAPDFEGLADVAVVDIAPFLDAAVPENVPALPASDVDPQQLAYVIYTSGSTGTPKGVGVPHAGLAHLVAWQESVWPVGPGDRGTHLAGLAFDATVWELWMNLATGGTLVVPQDELRLDPPKLADWIVRERLNVVFAPTPIAERLLAEPRMREAHELRALLSGGDKLTRRPEPGLPFTHVNAYGPAENAVVSSAGDVETLGSAQGLPTIGRPLPGVSAYVLDARMQPVPVGAPGELYVGGRGLARGYRDRPGLTASRFVPDPFAEEPGARLYRTGDRVRVLADGRMAFLGRTDHQVKVRGARLELGEIEAVLSQHEGLREVAVGTTGEGSGRALVAFFVAEDEGDGADRAEREEMHVDDWRRLYDSTYGSERSDDDAADARFDLVGWMSSYDGQPIPRAEMGTWVDEAVTRIRALGPKRVLEIGSGTGLLLYRLAPETERYVGVDFSAEAIERVRQEIKRPGAEIEGVELFEARADEAAALVDGEVDTLILNSVVQYFPSMNYLEEVLVSALERVATGGRVFIGDVRHADLDRAFHGAIALAQAAEDEPVTAVAVRAEEIASREGELLVSPAFFHALAERCPRIRGVRVVPKRFSASNELSQFRYDVVLELDTVAMEPAGAVAHRAFTEFGDRESLRAFLAAERPSGLVVEGIPNARVAGPVAVARELLDAAPEAGDPEPAARVALRAERAARGALDPADLWRVGAELGLDAEVRCTSSPDGTLELHVGATGAAPQPPAGGDRASLGRAPAGPAPTVALETGLRDWLEARLPSYMIPERFVSIGAMPLTNRGKVDRRRLVSLDPGRHGNAAQYVAPRGALEATVAEVFGRVLSIERVGARDDFFDLGGHSLLATRVVAELEDALGIEIELRTLFGATTVESLAAAIAPLAEGSGSTAARGSGADTEIASPAPIGRRTFGDAPAPASFGQRRLWLLEKLLPGTPAYHMPARARIEGPLDTERLAAALDGLVERHEALRTALVEQPGESGDLDVVQIVAPPAPLPLDHLDLSRVSAQERAQRAEAAVVEHVARPFALDAPPLVRALLLRWGPDHHELVVTLHHAIADGWSVGVILRELGLLYRALEARSDPALPELPITYRDYAAWQREDERSGRDAAFWAETLAGAPSQLDLPIDRPRPPVPSFRGDRVPVAIDARATEALDALGRERGATRFMVALAAWQVVVRTLAGEDDLTLVTPVAGRRRPETHGLVGFFVNTVPIRTRIRGEASFAELVDATRASCLGSFDHVDLSFEAILEAVRPNRSLVGAPFAQVAFALQNAPGGAAELDGVRLSIEPVETGTAKTDLSLMLDEPDSAFRGRTDGLSGVLEFASDLFDRDTAEAVARAFEHVLGNACADPTRTVDALGGLVALPPSERGDRVAPPAVPALVADRERSNLDDNQLLVWIGHQLDPDAPLHILGAEFAIEAAIDPDAFQAAFDVLVRSSDVMRSVVVEHEGIPRIEVREQVDAALARFDVADLDADAREARIRAFAFAPLDLSQQTFRSALFHTGNGRYAWVIAQHQIVSDAESLQLLEATADQLYQQAVAGDLPNTVPMPAFLDHLAWERAEREAGGFDAAQAHWQSLLDERSERPRFYGSTGSKTGLHTERVRTLVPPDTIDRLEVVLGELAGDGAVRPSTRLRLFLAVLAAYLHRISGQERVVVGMPWRNRRRETAQGTLGLFMRPVPIAVEIRPEDTLRTLFERTGPALKEALRHGEQVVRNPIDAPLYDVSLNWHTVHMPSFAGEPLHPRWLHTGLGFDSLALQVEDFGGTGELALEFDLHTDVFDDELAALAVRHVSTLLESALATPDTRIDALALEPQEEGTELLPGLAEAPASASVLDAFDAQVSAAPDALAVIDGDREVDYGELDRAARGLARRLCARGVGVGDVVAIAIDRSVEAIAGMLGVLRSGAGFLVLEPGTPTERMDRMLRTADVRWVLAAAERREALPDGPWQCLGPAGEGEAADAPSEVSGSSLPEPSALDIAYVAFTSGSTGEPRGVAVHHGALASFARAAVTTYDLGPNDRMLQFSSLGFDASIEEIFGALRCGAALVLRDGPMLVDARRFIDRCRATGVTVVDLPTAFWHQLSKTLVAQDLRLPASLRLVILGGERLDAAALDPWRAQVAQGPVPAIVNTYGPTETTVVVSHHAVSVQREDPRRREIPIGIPFGDAELHVVDRSGAPAPAGVVGELFVGGPTVALGYVGRSAETAQRFVPDPFSGRPGARLYRTGDLVRRRPDGALEFVGRADRQVKVRGHRVELAEVERTALALDGVSEVAVVDVPAAGGAGRALVGFAVAPSFAAADLRGALGERLPTFMVPSRWVLLDALPRDTRGKTDRSALLARVPDHSTPSEHYVAPRGEVEGIVAEVWAEVLGLEKVGANDNFFDLGGTSLSLVQMHPALVERLGVSLELVDLFRHPTVRLLARYLSDGAEDEARNAVRRDERAHARREALARRRGRRGGEDRP
ncbi:MAG: amino acid adenylation domain-containing protein [Myxococcota bacterium]